MSEVNLIASRYAKALFGAGLAANKIDECAQNIDQLRAVFAENDNLVKAIKSPLVSINVAANIVNDLTKLCKISGLSANFLAVVAQHGRLAHFQEIADSFMAMVAVHHGEVNAVVISAQPIDSKLQKQISEQCLHLVKAEKINIDYQIKPEIIGGLIVKIGSVQIDDSISNKLNQVVTRMKGA